MNAGQQTLLSKIGEHMMHAMYFDLSRYLIAAGVLTAILWAGGRWLEVRRIQNRRAKRQDYTREFFSSIRTVFFFGVTTISTLVMREYGLVNFTIQEFSILTLAWQTAVMVIAHDAYFYWMHRGLHHRKLFKATHLHHHKSRTPTPWAAYSFSTWEAITEAAFVPLFLLATSLLGITYVGFAIFLFLWHMIIRNVIGHAGIEIYPRGWVDNRATRWWNTTTHHDLHHSSGNYNFGLYFTWWDRWMGTEHPRYRQEFRKVTSRQAETVTGEAAVN